MSPATERRLLQAAVALACLVPLSAGGLGVVRGLDWIGGDPLARDLQSHGRYLSGLLFGIGLAYLASLPAIERHRSWYRLLGLVIVSGGLARLVSWLLDGAPSAGHQFGLVMELIVVPALTLWQGRIAQRAGGVGADGR